MIPLCLAMLLATAAGDVVARVDGVEIARRDLAERAAELRARGMPASPEQAVDSLVLDVLLAAEARRTGLAQTPAVRDRAARELRRAAAAAMLEQEVAALPVAGEDELRRLYHARADSVRLRILAFPSEDAARVNLALVKRSGVFDDATRSPAPGFAVPGWDVPKLRAQLSPDVADLAFGAPIGAVAGPVQLQDGWAIFEVLERTVGDARGFAAEREAIAKFARDQNAELARRHARERLRLRAKITVDRAFLEGLGKRREVTAAEREHVVAKVNGQAVRYRDIEESVRRLSAGSGHAAGAVLREQMLTREIEDRLVEDVATEKGFLRDPAVVARAPWIERRVLATAMVERVAGAVAAPAEKDVRAYWAANVARTGKDLESVRGAISELLLEGKRGEALQAKARELRGRAEIVVDRDALRAAERT